MKKTLFVNKILKKKWQARDLEIHKQKLLEVKAQTNTSEPVSLKFPLLKNKKRQIEEDKITEIERANRLLLEKMTIIMNSDSEVNHNNNISSVSPLRQRFAAVNNTLNYCGQQSVNNSAILRRNDSQDNSISRRSLNKRRQRMKHINKINQENKVYPDKWKQHEEKHDKILRIRSEYPEQYDEKQNASRRMSTQRSRQNSIHNALKFRNHNYHNNLYNNPSGMELFSRKEVVTSGGELVTQPPLDLQTDDEMDDLIKDVVNEANGDGGGPLDLQGGGVLDIEGRGFNSDLREKPKKMTPTDTKNLPKLHQTVSHFNSRQQSVEGQFQNQKQINDNISSKMPISASKGQFNDDYQENNDPIIYAEQKIVPHNHQSRTLEQVDSIRPLSFKYQNGIDPQRIVLYREDYREIIQADSVGRRRLQHPKYYIVEVSRSRYRLYIIAVKIPNKYLDYVFNGKGIYQIAFSSKAQVFYFDVTEKQGKKLIQECSNDFKLVMERLYIQFGRLHVRDLENILKFGGPQTQLVQQHLYDLNSQRNNFNNQPTIDMSPTSHLDYPINDSQNFNHIRRQPQYYTDRGGGVNNQESQQFNVAFSHQASAAVNSRYRQQKFSKIRSSSKKPLNNSQRSSQDQPFNNDNNNYDLNSSIQSQSQFNSIQKSQHFPSINRKSQSKQPTQVSMNSNIGVIPGNWEVVKSPVAAIESNKRGNNILMSQDKGGQQNSRNYGKEKEQQMSQFVETFVEKGSVRLNQD